MMVNLLSKIKMSNGGNSRSRFLGPGTMVIIVGLIAIAGWKLLVPPKVTIERQVETSGQGTLEKRPSLLDLLSWSNQLQLTTQQKNSLAKLHTQEQEQLAPVNTQITKYMQDFNSSIELRRPEGISLADIQAEVAPISALSKAKRQIEQSFAKRALEVLNQMQRQKAKEIWQEKQTRLKAKVKKVVAS